MHEALSDILFRSTNYSVKANRTASYLLMFLSEIDGRETKRVICYLTYLSAGFVINSLQQNYAIYIKDQVERELFARLVNYLAFPFTLVIVVRLHDVDRHTQTNQE